MTLDEAFLKYSDDIRLTRKSKPWLDSSIEFLKDLKVWGDEELIKIGFIIPRIIIEDANADDWELIQ